MRFHLTERFVRGRKAEGGRSPIFRDDELVGFGVQIRPNGRKTFTLDYVIDGRRHYVIDGGGAACSLATIPIGPLPRLGRKRDGTSAASISGMTP
jgi:hypothetical protein